VVLDDEDSRFLPRAFPAVNAKLVAHHYHSGRHLVGGPPAINEMTEGDAERTFRRVIPIPPEWADQFLDSPSFEEVCGRLETLTSRTSEKDQEWHEYFQAMA
jgi:hypothetical protein